MKKNKLFKLFAVTLFGACISQTAFSLPVTDLIKSCKPLINKNQKIENPPVRGMTERVHKRLTRALELIANEQYDEGIVALESLADSSSDNYIKSIVHLNIASSYAQQSKYDKALPHYTKSLKFGDGELDHQRLQDLRLNVASLMYGIDNKSETMRLLNDWFKYSIKDNANAYILYSVIKAEEGDYKTALCPAYYAIMHEPKPKKNYYSVLLVSHYELKDLRGSAEILKEMVQLFPAEKTYWRQLSNLYLQLDRVKESLAVMEMLYLKGGLETEADYKSLANLFAYEEIPYRSAEILKEGIDKGLVKPEISNLKTIATNYQVSREIDKAIDAYGRTAEVAEDGEHYLTQADLYAEKEDWRKAISALNKALNKGVKDTGRAFFTRGSAEASLGQCKKSLETFEQATKYSKWRQRANAWIAYVKDRQRHDKC
ncbi:tetratricopeptide repeat protein [Aliikangiella sp. IMCC44653]